MVNFVGRFKEKHYGSSGNTSGLSSSLAFTPVQVKCQTMADGFGYFHTFSCFFSVSLQGIELSNPNAQAQSQAQLAGGTQSTYFSATGTFSKIKKT